MWFSPEKGAKDYWPEHSTEPGPSVFYNIKNFTVFIAGNKDCNQCNHQYCNAAYYKHFVVRSFFFMSGLYTSLENAEAATKSCEPAVLIEAAKILQRKIPAIKAGNNPLRDSINTCSRSASERELFKYAFPMIDSYDEGISHGDNNPEHRNSSG